MVHHRTIDTQRAESEALDTAGRPAHGIGRGRQSPLGQLVLYRKAAAEVGDAAHGARIDHHAGRHLPSVAQRQRGAGERIVVLDAEGEGTAGAGVAERLGFVQAYGRRFVIQFDHKAAEHQHPDRGILVARKRVRFDHQFLRRKFQAGKDQRHAGP